MQDDADGDAAPYQRHPDIIKALLRSFYAGAAAVLFVFSARCFGWPAGAGNMAAWRRFL